MSAWRATGTHQHVAERRRKKFHGKGRKITPAGPALRRPGLGLGFTGRAREAQKMC